MDNEKTTVEEKVEAAAKKATISEGAKELDTRKTKRMNL